MSRTTRMLARSAVCLALSLAGLLGCAESEKLSEADLMAQLEASGLHVERLSENKLTPQQRARLGAQPETMFSVRVSDASGSTQSMTLVQFDKDWQAKAVGDEGVNGFVVKNWFFVGTVSQNIRSQIEAALL